MDMHVPQARDQVPALAFDLPPGTPGSGDLRIVANRDNPVASQGDRLIRNASVMYGIDYGRVADQHIGMLAR